MNIRSISTITAATLSLLSLGLQCALADDIRATPQVRVTGKSSQHIAPDRMFWTMKVENKGKELEQVADAHLKHAASLLAFLKKQGIDEKKLQTSQMEFGENMVYKNRERIKEGYIATTTVNFSSEKFELYQPIWKGVAKLGNISIQRVDYQIENRGTVEEKLRVLALKDAQGKAKSLATALGSKVGPALTISEHSGNHPESIRTKSYDSFGLDEEVTASSPGTLKISSSVEVAFKLLD